MAPSFTPWLSPKDFGWSGGEPRFWCGKECVPTLRCAGPKSDSGVWLGDLSVGMVRGQLPMDIVVDLASDCPF